jgi:hypothetical protein
MACGSSILNHGFSFASRQSIWDASKIPTGSYFFIRKKVNLGKTSKSFSKAIEMFLRKLRNVVPRTSKSFQENIEMFFGGRE